MGLARCVNLLLLLVLMNTWISILKRLVRTPLKPVILTLGGGGRKIAEYEACMV